jgi:hypothetical protein
MLVANYGDSSAAYTGFNVPIPLTSEYLNGLDGEGSPEDNKNVIAIHVDGSYGTEHWYAGAGIYRHVWLEKTPLVHIVPNGVYAGYSITDAATITPTVEVANNGTVDATGCTVTSTLLPPSPALNQQQVHALTDSAAPSTVTVTAPVPRLKPGGSTIVTLPNVVVPQKELKLWSVKAPNLYTLTTTLTCASTASTTDATDTRIGSTTDATDTSIGLRTFAWSHDNGLALNGERVKVRGFCQHDDFTAVGMAVPERINLFRAQALRGVGGNGWRMSHNSYRNTLYSTLDRVGVLVWDETRDLREPQRPAFGQMVKEHRNHPSIMLWSFCNEGGCSSGANHTLAQEFKTMAHTLDPSRLVSGNMRGDWKPPGGSLYDQLEVLGYSHPSGAILDAIHFNTSKAQAGKALIASECCSCMTMRGENDKGADKAHSLTSFNAPCLADQVNRSDDGRPWAIGSLIWTLFDYYGEPYTHAWPHVSSSYGSFDLAGFPKAAVWWYRALWLSGIPTTDAGRPALPAGHTVRIVQHNNQDIGEDGTWMVPSAPRNTNRTVQVYTDCPAVELFVNGKSMGVQSVARYMWAEFTFPIANSAGNLTAVALDSYTLGSADVAAAPLASHTVMTAGAATAVVLSIDVPSALTGTGSALLLDGQDVGLLRATITDKDGNTAAMATNMVTFAVISGPGRVLGVGNGDPTNHELNQVSHRSAYHGLVRGVIQVTHDAASSVWHREAMRQMDLDGGRRTTVAAGNDSSASSPIVLEASSPGLTSSRVTIQVSTDEQQDGVLAVAARSVGSAYTSG